MRALLLVILAVAALHGQSEPCTETSWPDSIRTRLENYWDSGFPAATAVCSADSAAQWHVLRGDAWVWADAVMTPPGKTRPEIFARLSGLQTGAPVVLADVERAERWLARLGYYVQDGPTRFYRIAGRNRLVPVMAMREIASSRLEALVAYDSDAEQWNGRIVLELLNVAGTARDFRFSGENGSLRRYGSVYYKEPMLLNTRWNALLRAEFLDQDSLRERSAELEMQYRAGFEWTFSMGAGVQSEDWKSLVRLNYDNRDRLPIPRRGSWAQGELSILTPRHSDTAGQRLWLDGQYGTLWPLSANWNLSTSLMGAGLLPVREYAVRHLRVLGGYQDFRALRPYSVRSRAYGLAETDLRWTALRQSALHLFLQPGMYRARPPLHGWKRVWGYGLGWEQGADRWSVTLYYTLMQNLEPAQGLLNMSVRTYF